MEIGYFLGTGNPNQMHEVATWRVQLRFSSDTVDVAAVTGRTSVQAYS